MNDQQVQPNYIPQEKPTEDYVQNYADENEMMYRKYKETNRKDSLEILFEEFKLPIFIGFLFFIFQLPFVRKNMKSPALQNQTGRFARSVKVTNVVSTQKGYPSYAYTYDNRYRVYETTSGSRFSSPDRDPRVLIQRSIREAAAKIAMGRFSA